MRILSLMSIKDSNLIPLSVNEIVGVRLPESTLWGFTVSNMSQEMFRDGTLFNKFGQALGFSKPIWTNKFIFCDSIIADKDTRRIRSYKDFEIVSFTHTGMVVNALYFVESTLHVSKRNITVLTACTDNMLFDHSVDFFVQSTNVHDLILNHRAEDFGVFPTSEYKVCGVCGQVYTRWRNVRGAYVCSYTCNNLFEHGHTLLQS